MRKRRRPEEIAPDTSRDDLVEGRLRLLLGALGVVVLVSGVVAAFLNRDGVATAALLAAGFALLFVGYLGRYITRIKFRDFEAELERVRRKAAETLSTLHEVARSYDSVRAGLRPGGERDSAMERQLREAELYARSHAMEPSEIDELFGTNEKGKRISVLGAMKGDPNLRNFEIVLQAIDNPHSGFDQDRFLLLASEMLPDLDEKKRQRLREVIERQRQSGKIKPDRIRWLTSERLLKLLER